MERFTNELTRQMQNHVPRFSKPMEKSTLPWLTSKCVKAIEAKHFAEGNPNYNEVARQTNVILHEEKCAYTAKLKAKMEQLPKCSKQWWTLNRQLLNKQPSLALFPASKILMASGVRLPSPRLMPSPHAG